MWKQLLRVTAHVINFCQNILFRSSRDKEKNQVNVGLLNAEEEYWIKKTQAGLSGGITKGSYKSLSPFVGDKGIVRVGGRVNPVVISYIHTFIEASPFAISTCPIILFVLGGKLPYTCRLSRALLQLCFDKWAKTTFAAPQIVQTGETGNETSNSIGFPKIRL